MTKPYIACMGCGARHDLGKIIYTCPACGGLLDIVYDYAEIGKALTVRKLRSRPIGVWRYRELMPILDEKSIVSLNEGGTPLYRCDRLAKDIGIKRLYVKFEGANPTGSFKDRGMTVGVTKAVELGASRVLCASTGNTSASLAAYAARAGIQCLVILPAGKVALGKLSQAMMHGALVVGIRGNFDRALELAREFSLKENAYLLNSINPYRPEGQKSIGFEIADQLDFEMPDRICLPVGNAANIWAIYKGLREFHTLGFIDTMPKMTGIQAEGSQPITHAIKNNLGEFEPQENVETLATAIRIGNPVSGSKALTAIRSTNGTAESVTDDEILAAQRDLARLEGIGIEPASAASIAGLRKLVKQGTVDQHETVVCVATGHLLKDPETVIKSIDAPVEIDPTLDALIDVARTRR